MLEKLGTADRPESHFHDSSLDRWIEDYGLAGAWSGSREDMLRAVFASARDRGTGGTGVFGLRMQRGSFCYFMEQVDRLYPGRATDVERIEAAFGPTLFVYLRRPAKLAQAISRVMAVQTGLWHRKADGSDLERLGPPRAPRYDRDAIARHMKELTALDAEWEHWFAQEGLAPLRVSYDELAGAPQDTLARILVALGLDPSQARSVHPPTARLAGAESRIWAERFLAQTPASQQAATAARQP